MQIGVVYPQTEFGNDPNNNTCPICSGHPGVLPVLNKEAVHKAIQLGTANATSVLQKFGATNGLLKKGEWGSWEKVEVKKI